MYYELVNLSSGNRIGEFDTESEALQDVQAHYSRFGPQALSGIALTEQDEAGNGKIIAEGDELAARAEQATAMRRSRSAAGTPR